MKPTSIAAGHVRFYQPTAATVNTTATTPTGIARNVTQVSQVSQVHANTLPPVPAATQGQRCHSNIANKFSAATGITNKGPREENALQAQTMQMKQFLQDYRLEQVLLPHIRAIANNTAASVRPTDFSESEGDAFIRYQHAAKEFIGKVFDSPRVNDILQAEDGVKTGIAREVEDSSTGLFVSQLEKLPATMALIDKLTALLKKSEPINKLRREYVDTYCRTYPERDARTSSLYELVNNKEIVNQLVFIKISRLILERASHAG